MAFGHGKDQYFALEGASAGAPTNISTYVSDVSFPQEVDTPEVTTLGKTARVYIVGLVDSTFSVSGYWDPTLDAIFGTPTTNAQRTFQYGPQGNTASYVRYTGECFITSYEVSGGVDDPTGWSADLQVTDAVTRDTF